MQRLSWRQWSLTVKISTTIIVVIILAVVGITLVSIAREQLNFKTDLQQQAELQLDTLIAAGSNPLYKLDSATLQQIMDGLQQNQVVLAGRFYDPQGRVIADAFNPQSFNVDADPFGQSLLRNKTAVFVWQDNSLLAGKAIIVGTEPLGAVSVSLPTAALDTKVAAVQSQGVEAALIIVAIGVILALLLGRSIAEPVREMTQVAQTVAAGNLTQRIVVRSGGELATLSSAFNTMIDQLRKTIDDLKLGAEELRKSEAQLRETSRFKDEFLAVMSHELRTPLNAIIGLMGIVMMGNRLNERDSMMIARARSNSDRLLGLINNILDISRMQAGRLEIVPNPVDIRPLVEKLQSDMAVLAEQKNLKFSVYIDVALPDVILTDEDAFNKILTNLVANALKFTKEGSVTLKLLREQDNFIVAVKDTGIGIPAHMQEIIFDSFRQVDASSGRAYGGSGLGLAIVRNLCEAMHGTIRLDSKIGVGSTFTVTLPLEVEPVTVVS